jgi:hypothetical protein
MKKHTKRIVGFLVACIMIISSATAVFAYEPYPGDGNEPITDVLPNPRLRFTGSKTSGTLPRNVNGNQGTSQYSGTIGTSHILKTFVAKFSNFTNSMASVNASVYAGSTYLAGLTDISSGGSVEFTIPYSATGLTLTIYMSTNSIPGKCDIAVSAK